MVLKFLLLSFFQLRLSKNDFSTILRDSRFLLHGGPTFDPVGRCSHVTLMHEKTLLIQRIKSVFFKSESQSKVFSSKSQSKLFSKSESGSKAFFDALTTDQMCFSTRRHFFEEKLGWIKSVFSCISVM